MHLVEFAEHVAGHEDGLALRRKFPHHRAQFEAIQPNSYFVPTSADARMDPWSPQIQKQLVDLGIYFSDGGVNMQTAEKMGWAQRWREDEAKATAAQEAAAMAAKAK